MSIHTDTENLKKLFEDKPIFKAASQKNIAKRHNNLPIIDVISVAYWDDDPYNPASEETSDPAAMEEMIMNAQELFITYVDKNEASGTNSSFLSDLDGHGFRIGNKVIYPEF